MTIGWYLAARDVDWMGSYTIGLLFSPFLQNHCMPNYVVLPLLLCSLEPLPSKLSLCSSFYCRQLTHTSVGMSPPPNTLR
jgi:hypothetical protein